MTSETKITTEINGDKWRLFDSQGYLQQAGAHVRYSPEEGDICELITIGASWYRYEDFDLVTADRIEHQNGWYLTRDL